MDAVVTRLSFTLVIAAGSFIGMLWPAPKDASPGVVGRQVFSFCHFGGGTDCVVDGDTVWVGGMKVRVADIDAPETHEPKCAAEADLGARATRRLGELLNAGPFEMVKAGRDTDRYGRRLRLLVRDGRSIGGDLVLEGLARTWDGRRRSWCGREQGAGILFRGRRQPV